MIEFPDPSDIVAKSFFRNDLNLQKVSSEIAVVLHVKPPKIVIEFHIRLLSIMVCCFTKTAKRYTMVDMERYAAEKGDPERGSVLFRGSRYEIC